MFLTQLFERPVFYVVAVVVVLVSVVLHELGHVFAATWEGDTTPRIRGHLTWNPVVHMGWLAIALLLVVGVTFGRTPVTPARFRHRRWGEALVAASGPLTNLALAIVAGVTLHVLNGLGLLHLATQTDLAVGALFWTLMLHMNVVLFLLNLIPLPPLDGFTVAEGTFHLGELGAQLRRLGMFPLVLAILLVNSDAFDSVVDVVTGLILRASRSALPFL